MVDFIVEIFDIKGEQVNKEVVCLDCVVEVGYKLFEFGCVVKDEVFESGGEFGDGGECSAVYVEDGFVGYLSVRSNGAKTLAIGFYDEIKLWECGGGVFVDCEWEAVFWDGLLDE